MIPIGTMISLGYTILQNRDKIAGAMRAQQPAKPPQFTTTWIQESLNTLEQAGLTVDGKYGHGTREAVSKYQEKHGLAVDGWAGFETTAHMWDALNKS